MSAAHDAATKKRKLIIAGLIGNAMEWYDFAVYGYFAAIIAPLFFPPPARPFLSSPPSVRSQPDFSSGRSAGWCSAVSAI